MSTNLPENLRKGKPYICPECHSDDVDETDIEEFQDCLIGKAYCIDCGAQFFQYFVYVGYTQDPRASVETEEIGG